MMARVPERIFIKPKEVDAGRGPQLATVPYPPVAGGRRRLLPPEGDWVSMEGTSGSFWTRRINEGSVEKAEPPKAEPPPAEPKAEPEPPKAPEPKQLTAPAEPGKKDGKE
jgi:hypothetical protein